MHIKIKELELIGQELSVLYVEDNPSLQTEVSLLLKDFFPVVMCASNGQEALEKMRESFFDIILTDLHMPVMGGIEMIKRIKDAYPIQRIIVTSAHDDREHLLQLIEFGIENFVQKPVRFEFLINALYKCALSIVHEKKEKFYTKSIAIINQSLKKSLDVLKSSSTQNGENINDLIYKDTLTKLGNRRFLDKKFLQLQHLKRKIPICCAIVFIDLDRFKEVNDTHGHEVGDTLLKVISQRLTDAIRTSDTLCRFGGDEFVIFFENLGNEKPIAKERLEGIAQKIIDDVNLPIKIDTLTCHVGASIGINLFTSDENVELSDVLKKADSAMYLSKQRGRNRFCFFSENKLL